MYRFTGRIDSEDNKNIDLWIDPREIVSIAEYEDSTRTIYLRGNETPFDVKESTAFILVKIRESQDA